MKLLFRNIWANSYFQGSFFITVANFIGGFLNYLFNIFVGRSLGPSGYGEITTLFSYITILSIPVGIVTQLVIIKIGSKKDNISYTAALFDWVLIKFRKYWFLFVAIICLSPFVPQVTNLSPIVGYSLIPLVVLAYLLAIYDGALQGLHLFFWASLIGIVSFFIKFLGSVIVLNFWSQIGIIILFLFLSSIVKGVLSQVKLSKILKSTKQNTIAINKNIVSLLSDPQLLITSISGAAIVVLSNLDILYVKKMFSTEEAGIYGSWSLFAKVILYILGPIITVSFIFFSSKKNDKYHSFVLVGGIVALLFSGIVAMFAYSYYGEMIINILFGKSFMQLLPFIEWASFFGTGYVLVIFMNNYFLAKGSNKAYILAGSIPFYIAGLTYYGKDLGSVMLVNIWFTFAILTIYLLLFFKERVAALIS